MFGGFPRLDAYPCLRCGDAPGVDEDGLCGRCHWAIREEVARGLLMLAHYLACWARYEEWCAAHGMAA